MNTLDFSTYREVWFVDFEFSATPGERPQPVRLVGREMHSGKVVRLFGDEIRQLTALPYATDESTLFIAYYSSAEPTCHLALGWQLPANVLDLYVEFRNLTNGRKLEDGAGHVHGGSLVAGYEPSSVRLRVVSRRFSFCGSLECLRRSSFIHGASSGRQTSVAFVEAPWLAQTKPPKCFSSF